MRKAVTEEKQVYKYYLTENSRVPCNGSIYKRLSRFEERYDEVLRRTICGEVEFETPLPEDMIAAAKLLDVNGRQYFCVNVDIYPNKKVRAQIYEDVKEILPEDMIVKEVDRKVLKKWFVNEKAARSFVLALYQGRVKVK